LNSEPDRVSPEWHGIKAASGNGKEPRSRRGRRGARRSWWQDGTSLCAALSVPPRLLPVGALVTTRNGPCDPLNPEPPRSHERAYQASSSRRAAPSSSGRRVGDNAERSLRSAPPVLPRSHERAYPKPPWPDARATRSCCITSSPANRRRTPTSNASTAASVTRCSCWRPMSWARFRSPGDRPRLANPLQPTSAPTNPTATCRPPFPPLCSKLRSGRGSLLTLAKPVS
jgi:hypothetical protein